MLRTQRHQLLKACRAYCSDIVVRKGIATCEAFLPILSRSADNSRTDFAGRNVDLRVAAVLEALLERDPRTAVSFQRFAQACNLSLSHLRHLFKRNLGLSLQQCLKLIRLEKSKVLLESSFLSVKEVAQRAGFGDVSHFVRDFKERYGTTPTKARILARSRRHISSRQMIQKQSPPINSHSRQ